jgi:hypothetical protein
MTEYKGSNMPRKKLPRPCRCGCGEMTQGGEFCPGHDAKVLSAIISRVGGVANLRLLIEKETGAPLLIHTGS